jgi:hypothetical protein
MEQGEVLVFGGIAMDIVSRASGCLQPGTSNIANITTTPGLAELFLSVLVVIYSLGGVGYNMASVLNNLGT